MTDKELAEEYEEKKAECIEVNDDGKRRYSSIDIQEAYLAGLKVGRPQWHDLRKDPNDLPKDNDEKLCFYEKGKVVARYDSEYSCWETCFNNLETIIPLSVIIAWCELPKFER